MNLPDFKIIGTNQALKAFLWDCEDEGIPNSKANSFFRDDYEHCLIPPYAYDRKQPTNTKLQTMEVDSYKPELVFDLKSDYKLALDLCRAIHQSNTEKL